MMVCGGCGQTIYCSKDCQKKHWKHVHRTQCADARKTLSCTSLLFAEHSDLLAFDPGRPISSPLNAYDGPHIHSIARRILEVKPASLLPPPGAVYHIDLRLRKADCVTYSERLRGDFELDDPADILVVIVLDNFLLDVTTVRRLEEHRFELWVRKVHRAHYHYTSCNVND